MPVLETDFADFAGVPGLAVLANLAGFRLPVFGTTAASVFLIALAPVRDAAFVILLKALLKELLHSDVLMRLLMYGLAATYGQQGFFHPRQSETPYLIQMYVWHGW